MLASTLSWSVPSVSADVADLTPAVRADGDGIRPVRRQVRLADVPAAPPADAAELAPALQGVALREAGIEPGRLDATPELLTRSIESARFDAVGLSWDRRNGSPPAAWVRVHEAAGWSEWNLLPPVDIRPDDDTGEGGRSGRTSTEPLLTGGATAVQVRVDADSEVRDVRVDLIDAGRAAGDAAIAGDASTSISALAAPPAPALTSPTFITRSQWGADESLRRAAPTFSSTIKVGVVHHTASTNGYTASTAAAQIRSIYAYHTLSLGWNDIAYNVLVDRDGRVFEGRYGGVDQPVLSGATGGFNRFTFSVSALGDFSQVAAPGVMVESIARVMAWKFAIHYVDPLGSSQLTSAGADTARYPAGQTVTVPNVMAHRDTNFTSCPGQSLYAQLGTIRNRIKQLLPVGLDHPGATVIHRTPGVNGSVRVTSGLLYGGNWNLTISTLDRRVVREYAASGHSVDVTWPMTAATGEPVASGTYLITLVTEQNGTRGQPWETVVSTAGLFGNFEAMSLSPAGSLASGWASVSDGQAARIALVTDGVNIVRIPADSPRPDVGAFYPGLGGNHGFTGTPALSVGPHTVCAWAEGDGLQSALLGCRSFDEPRAEPFGNAESVQPVYGGLRVSGWMLDRHTAAPITARFYLDGRHGGDVAANLSRPDVGSTYRAYGANHGFTALLPAGPGLHSVCVNGVNAGPGTSEGHLRCLFGSPPTGMPLGNFEQLVAGTGKATVRGWTFDPDDKQATSVHVYVDGRFAGAAAAGLGRPDLAGPFPLMGTGHGFDTTVGVSGPGPHTVCVYAINAGPPAGNPLLGCRST